MRETEWLYIKSQSFEPGAGGAGGDIQNSSLFPALAGQITHEVTAHEATDAVGYGCVDIGEVQGLYVRPDFGR